MTLDVGSVRNAYFAKANQLSVKLADAIGGIPKAQPRVFDFNQSYTPEGQGINVEGNENSLNIVSGRAVLRISPGELNGMEFDNIDLDSPFLDNLEAIPRDLSELLAQADSNGPEFARLVELLKDVA